MHLEADGYGDCKGLSSIWTLEISNGAKKDGYNNDEKFKVHVEIVRLLFVQGVFRLFMCVCLHI
jgi:hypothetical protein